MCDFFPSVIRAKRPENAVVYMIEREIRPGRAGPPRPDRAGSVVRRVLSVPLSNSFSFSVYLISSYRAGRGLSVACDGRQGRDGFCLTNWRPTGRRARFGPPRLSISVRSALGPCYAKVILLSKVLLIFRIGWTSFVLQAISTWQFRLNRDPLCYGKES